MKISKDEAITRLRNRYFEEIQRFPLLEKVGLVKYIAANLNIVMRNGLLREYSDLKVIK